METSLLLISVVVLNDDGLGSDGFGHVISAARLELQCWRMFSYKYHFLFKSSPGITVRLGEV